jgi:hypothetical protein
MLETRLLNGPRADDLLQLIETDFLGNIELDQDEDGSGEHGRL